MANLEKMVGLMRFALGLGAVALAASASGCVPVILGVAAFQLAGVAIDLTHPRVNETAIYMVWERQELNRATAICNASGAPPDSDCVSYEMQASH
jgi:hypothetical protein